MFFNSTVLTSLTLSSFLQHSPLISNSLNCQKKLLSLSSFQITNSISHFLYIQSEISYLSIYQSKFDSFLKRPFTIHQNENCEIRSHEIVEGVKVATSCINLSYSIFRNTHSDDEGGVFLVTSNTGSTISINQCQFARCRAKSKGGALYINDTSTTSNPKLLIYSSHFTDCSIFGESDLAGGAICCQTGEIAVINSTFSNDTIESPAQGASYGGAIYAKVLSSNNNKICYSVFESCYVPINTSNSNSIENGQISNSSGGAIYLELQYSRDDEQFEIRGSNFTNCYAESGSFLFFKTPISLKINNSRFSLNSRTHTAKSLIRFDSNTSNSSLVIADIGIEIRYQVGPQPIFFSIYPDLIKVPSQPTVYLYVPNSSVPFIQNLTNENIYQFIRYEYRSMGNLNLMNDFAILQELNYSSAPPIDPSTPSISDTGSNSSGPGDGDGGTTNSSSDALGVGQNSGLSTIAIIFIVLACILFVIGIIVCLVLLLRHKCACCEGYEISPANHRDLTYF